MSKDIRSFFSVVSKKTGTDSKPSSSAPKAKKSKKTVILESDDEDVIPPTPSPRKRSKKNTKTVILSDSDDDDKSKNKKPQKTASPRKSPRSPKKQPVVKLKPISVADMFESTPVKQSEVKIVPEQSTPAKVEKETPKKRGRGKKAKVSAEAKVHNNSSFAQTLMDLDDDGLDDDLLEAVKEFEKSPDGAKENNSANSSKKRPRDSIGEKKAEKKIKLEHKDSGVEEGQPEPKDKKTGNMMAYQKYLNRSGPRLAGLKDPPKGKPTALQNLCFIRTGVLESLEQEQFEQIIKSHGGRTVSAVSRKVNFIVAGDEPGESKLAKAASLNIPKISEDELFDLILTKSGMQPKYVNKAVSEDLGIGNEEFMPENSETNGNDNHQDKDDELPTIKTEKPSPKKASTAKISSPKQSKPFIKVERIKKQTDPSELPLWQKYKPKSVEQIIGQQNNVAKLKRWLQNWVKNQDPAVKKTLPKPSPWAKNDTGAFFKAALLSGPPGVGKTTTATLVAKSLNLDIVEFNASDTRSKRLLQEQVAQLLSSKTLTGFAKGENSYNSRVLIMDEVDGMSGNEDRGGVQELIQLIKNSKVPIICICNDRNHQKMRSLVNYCFDLRFPKPSNEQITAAFKSILVKEKINISQQVLAEIIAGTGGDVRQSLNHLTMYTLSQDEVTVDEAKKAAASGKKDVVLGPWDVVRLVFSESEQRKMNIHQKLELFFYDYSINPLFVQENYMAVEPKGCTKAQTLKRLALTAESLSYSDLIETKIRTGNRWDLLPTQALFSSVLPGFFMSGQFKDKINFPSWLGNNSKRNKFNRLAADIQAHTRTTINSNKSSIILDYLPPLRDIIFAPLLQSGKDGVEKTVGLMKDYNLRREDLDALIELTEWQANKNPMNKVDSKVKAALTRLYNKEVNVLPYTVTKKKKIVDDLYGEEDEEGDDEEEDDITKNPMIKMKTGASSSTSAKGKKGDGASTSKKAEPKKRGAAKKK